MQVNIQYFLELTCSRSFQSRSLLNILFVMILVVTPPVRSSTASPLLRNKLRTSVRGSLHTLYHRQSHHSLHEPWQMPFPKVVARSHSGQRRMRNREHLFRQSRVNSEHECGLTGSRLIVLFVLPLLGACWIIIVTIRIKILVPHIKIVVNYRPDPFSVPVEDEAIDTALLTSLICGNAHLLHKARVTAQCCYCSDKPAVSIRPLLYIRAREAVNRE